MALSQLVMFAVLLTVSDSWMLYYKVWPTYQCNTAPEKEGYWTSGSCVNLTSSRFGSCVYYVKPECTSSSSFVVKNCTSSTCSSCNLFLASYSTCTSMCSGGSDAAGFNPISCITESPSPSPSPTKGGTLGSRAPWGTFLLCLGLGLLGVYFPN